jgi:hypothetical protein
MIRGTGMARCGEPDRGFRLHLRCRCCQRDSFLQAPWPPGVANNDRAVRAVVSTLPFECEVCPGQGAVLIGYKLIAEARDARAAA